MSIVFPLVAVIVKSSFAAMAALRSKGLICCEWATSDYKQKITHFSCFRFKCTF